MNKQTKICIIIVVSLLSLAGRSLAQPTLSGILVVGQSRMALVVVPNKPAKWYREGDSFEGYTLKSIDAKNNSIVIASAQEGDRTILLDVSIIKNLPIEDVNREIDAAKLDWKWIRSDSNPMRKQPVFLTPEQIREWKDLNERDRMEIINYYRRHGWQIRDIQIIDGKLRHGFSPITNPSDPVLTLEEIKKRSIPASVGKEK